MSDLVRNLTALHERYGRIDIDTAKPVAVDSNDHLHPRGTKHDNSEKPAFNAKVSTLLPADFAVLDLGCAGGGMVRSFIETGHLAVGIEGSDYSLKEQRAEWATIPDFLFTADITEPFALLVGGVVRKFDLITLWEVLEHIWQDNLPAVFSNIGRHLAPGGLVIASVSTAEDTFDGVHMHLTVKPREWWMETFDRLGWVDNPDVVAFIGPWDMVRGLPDTPHSFHVALKRKTE